MERLDKIIANRGIASRREVKELLRQGRVGCELCAGVAVLTQLLCCVCGMVT